MGLLVCNIGRTSIWYDNIFTGVIYFSTSGTKVLLLVQMRTGGQNIQLAGSFIQCVITVQ